MTKKEKSAARVKAGKKVWAALSAGQKAHRLACLRRGRKGKSSSSKPHKSQSKKSSPCRRHSRGWHVFG